MASMANMANMAITTYLAEATQGIYGQLEPMGTFSLSSHTEYSMAY
jgi:hypothetical protein